MEPAMSELTETQDDINTICRICLEHFATSDLFSIFDEPSPNTGSMVISQILTELTSCYRLHNNSLPKSVCYRCREGVYSAFSFKQQIEQSYRILLERYAVKFNDETAFEYGNTKNTTEIATQTEHISKQDCGVCEQKIFTAKDGLVAKKVNTQCPVCERKFSRSDHMRRHMRNMHDQQEKKKKSKNVTLDEPEIDLRPLKMEKFTPLQPQTPSVSASFPGLLQNEFVDEKFSTAHCDHTKLCKDELAPTDPIESSNVANDSSYDMDIKLETDYHIKKDFVGWDLMNKEDSADNFELITGAATPLAEEADFENTYESDAADPVEVHGEDEKDGKNAENTCSDCMRSFSRRSHLMRHMLIHLDQKPHACKLCSKRFARTDHLKIHLVNVHGKDLKCDICGWTCARVDALARHKSLHHNIADPAARGETLRMHRCECCDKSFVSKAYLRKHIAMHTNRVFTCKHCSATFKERKHYREHEKSHQDGKNYLCSICGDSFARNDYLTVHMRRHNGEKPYKCKYCDKGFPRATDLNIHERYHTGKKPNLCTLCGKGFHRAYNLTIHMRTHSGERPFKCDQCPKAFTQSNDLKAHIRRHTGERFKCLHCEAAFLQLYALRQHALNVHGIQIESITGRLTKTSEVTMENVINPQFLTLEQEGDVLV